MKQRWMQLTVTSKDGCLMTTLGSDLRDGRQRDMSVFSTGVEEGKFAAHRMETVEGVEGEDLSLIGRLHESAASARAAAEASLGHWARDNPDAKAALLELMATLERIYDGAMSNEEYEIANLTHP